MTEEHNALLGVIESRDPMLANLFSDIFAAFVDSHSADPYLDSAILVVTISRVAAADLNARAALIHQLGGFQKAGCLTAHQVRVFTRRIAQGT